MGRGPLVERIMGPGAGGGGWGSEVVGGWGQGLRRKTMTCGVGWGGLKGVCGHPHTSNPHPPPTQDFSTAPSPIFSTLGRWLQNLNYPSHIYGYVFFVLFITLGPSTGRNTTCSWPATGRITTSFGSNESLGQHVAAARQPPKIQSELRSHQFGYV